MVNRRAAADRLEKHGCVRRAGDGKAVSVKAAGEIMTILTNWLPAIDQFNIPAQPRFYGRILLGITGTVDLRREPVELILGCNLVNIPQL